MATPELFIGAVREAHAVFTAHRTGEIEVAEIAKRVHLPVTTVTSWAKALRLPVLNTQHFRPAYRLNSITLAARPIWPRA